MRRRPLVFDLYPMVDGRILFRRLGGSATGPAPTTRRRCFSFVAIVVRTHDRRRQRGEVKPRLGLTLGRGIGARLTRLAATTLGRTSLDGCFGVLGNAIPRRSLPHHGFPSWGFPRWSVQIVGGVTHLDTRRARFITMLPLGLTLIPVATVRPLVRLERLALAFAGGRLVLIEIVVQTLVVAAEAALMLLLPCVLPRAVVGDHTEIMIRELQIIFRVHPVSGELGVAGEVAVFLQKLGCVASRPVVDAIAVVAAPVAPVLATIVPAAVAAAGLTIIDQCVILALNAILKRTASRAYQHRAGSGTCLPGLPFCTRRALCRPTIWEPALPGSSIIGHRHPSPKRFGLRNQDKIRGLSPNSGQAPGERQ